MKVKIRRIKTKAEEQVVIECVEITPAVESIYSYVLTKGTELSGVENGRICKFELEDVCYFEAMDEKLFAYTESRVFEMKARLYEVEEAYKGYHFIRCSKSMVLNLMQLSGISPALNGRFWGHMKNGEKISISRQYVPALKAAVMVEKEGGKEA